MSLTLSKRLSNSKPLFRISSNLVAHASSATTSPPPPSPPVPSPSALNSLLTAPWSATQSRGITLSGSDVSSSIFSYDYLLRFDLSSVLLSLWLDASLILLGLVSRNCSYLCCCRFESGISLETEVFFISFLRFAFMIWFWCVFSF